MDARRRPVRVSNPLISFIVPVHNEADPIRGFLAAVTPVVARCRCRAEFLFVNDGSSDATLEVLFDLQDLDARVRIVNLSRNFGKEAALTAGLAESLGDVVIPIDVDLQDPPELLDPFLEQWRRGYDVVYGIRRHRPGDSRTMRLTARWFYKVFNAISPTPIPNDVGDFRLMDRRVVVAILAMEERNRFMKGLFSWVGYPSVGVEFDRPERSGGKTSWSPWKRWNFALDGLVSFSSAPLRIWTYIGLVIAACCGVYGLSVLGLAASGGIQDVPGYASLIIVVLFLGAMQLVSLGLIGEYLARVLAETKGRPLYLLEGIYNAPASATVPASADPVVALAADPVVEERRPTPAPAQVVG